MTGVFESNKTQPADRIPVKVWQHRSLNDPVIEETVGQDHRFLKKCVRAIAGFTTFNSARVVLGGIELLHLSRRGQLAPSGLGEPKTAAE